MSVPFPDISHLLEYGIENDATLDDLLESIQQFATSAPPSYPELKSDYEKSRPCPLEYKADVNTRKGIVTAYLHVFTDPTTGQPFVDSYLDVVERDCFSKSVAHLDAVRKSKNSEWLCPDLWQHDRHEQIGGIKGVTQDSTGVIYEAHLFQNIQRAREALELCERKAIGSSFGYDPVLFHHVGDIRHLQEVKLHEISQVTFPAAWHAPILSVKSDFFSRLLQMGQDAGYSSGVGDLGSIQREMKAASDRLASEKQTREQRQERQRQERERRLYAAQTFNNAVWFLLSHKER